MRRNTEGKLAIGAVILVLLLNLAWWGFVVWAIYTVITWLVTK